MAKRSQMRAKVHASNVKAHKRKIAEVILPSVIREQSQKRYKVIPARVRFELQRRSYLFARHGLGAVLARGEVIPLRRN